MNGNAMPSVSRCTKVCLQHCLSGSTNLTGSSKAPKFRLHELVAQRSTV